MIKAFVSHSSAQKEFALKLVNLIGRDFCIIDSYDFQPAYKSIDEIYDKIDQCTIFVLLLSKESIESDWVKKEIASAIAKFAPSQLNRFWPYIIDPLLNIDNCPEWIRKGECFNLKVFKSPELLRHDIEQKFRQFIWNENPDMKARETSLIGRQEEIDQFEQIRFSRSGRELRALIISGRSGVGKDAFAKQCAYKLGKPMEMEPYRLSLEAKSGIEDLVIQLNMIVSEYDEDTLKRSLAESVDDKVELVVKMLNVLYETRSVVFIDDNMACVLPNREIPEWLGKIIQNDQLNKQLALFIKSRITPNSYIKEDFPRLAHVQLHPLKRSDRKKLFYSLAEFYGLTDYRDTDVDFFVDKLLQSPSQIHHAVMAIAQHGVSMAKMDINRLIEIGDERAKPLIDHFKENRISLDVLIILAKYEFLGFDILEEIFSEELEDMQRAISDMLVYGIVSTFGLSGELIRLDHYVCDYIKRNRISLSTELSSHVNDVIEKHVVSASITKDVSVYFYDLKQNILRGRISSDSYLVPSVIIKAVIEAYNEGDYKQVIGICDKILNDQHNLNREVNWELTYWLCLSLCRLVKDDERNKERFWGLVKIMSGADKAFLKGFFYRYDEQFPKAEKCFMDALSISPNMDRAKRELVTVLLAQGKYHEALDLAKENYERSKENSYHIYAYFRCLVRKNGLKHDDVYVLDGLMKDVEENYSDKKDELLASMRIEYAYYIERKTPVDMIDLIKKTKKDFPNSIHVERVVKEYRRKQGL